jgi:hypothetical protein
MARKVVHRINRLDLSEPQQKAVEALLIRRNQIVADANYEIANLNQALDELAEMFSQQQRAGGDWVFAQDAPQQPLYLKRKEEKEDEKPKG